VKELLNDETKVVIRYSKLKGRGEFKLFSQFIDQLYVGPKFITSIAGDNRGADESKIEKLFEIKITKKK
jgi:hypothetical protein